MADKKISELNVASAVYDTDDFALVQAADTKQVNASIVKAYIGDAPTIVGGTINATPVGVGTQAAGSFTTLNSSSTTTLNGTTIPASKALLVTTDIGSSVQAYDADLTAWAGKTAPTGDAVGTSDSQTLTNKTISGASNTLSNIGNASLTNSSVTVNGNSVSLGGSTTVTASTTNALTISTGLSGTSFNGGSAVTIAIDSTVATLTGSQTLTNKTLTSPVISGGTINNTAIGGTTAAAGTFTALATTGNVTLGDASADTVTFNAATVTLNNSTTISAASTKTLTLNGGAGSNGLVLDASNNVGIGTSSPSAKLNVVGADVARFESTSNGAVNVYWKNSTQQYSYRLDPNNNGGRDFSIYDDTNSQFVDKYFQGASGYRAFYTNGSERMRLDSSGNLGLGVTPSASWDSSRRIMQIGGSGALWASTSGYGSYFVSNNAYFDGTSWRRINAGTASFFAQQSDSSFTWNNTTSSAAGSSFTPNQAMTLDASGNLGVGVTSPSYRLDLLANSANIPVIKLRNSNSGGYSGLQIFDESGTVVAHLGYGGSTTALASRMYVGTIASQPLVFTTNDAERARIDSSGNLLVGTTSFNYAANGVGIRSNAYSYFTATSNPSILLNRKGTSGSLVSINYEDSGVGSISTNGTSTAYNTTSDQRLKTNIAPSGSAIQSILDFPVDQFDWISTGEHQAFGAVAQKIIQIIPEMVSVPEDPEEMMGVDWSKAVPRLIKAYQELSAELESLKQKVNA